MTQRASRPSCFRAALGLLCRVSAGASPRCSAGFSGPSVYLNKEFSSLDWYCFLGLALGNDLTLINFLLSKWKCGRHFSVRASHCGVRCFCDRVLLIQWYKQPTGCNNNHFFNNYHQLNVFRTIILPILRSRNQDEVEPVPPHPGHQQASSSLLYTTSCKHSLVLLRMGGIIAWNMLS